MSRPKKPASHLRTAMVQIRVTPADKRALKKAAQKTGSDLSTWLRALGMNAVTASLAATAPDEAAA